LLCVVTTRFDIWLPLFGFTLLLFISTTTTAQPSYYQDVQLGHLKEVPSQQACG
jgi:hypothetical protein